MNKLVPELGRRGDSRRGSGCGPQAQAKDRQVGAVLMAENALDNLYFDYKLTGDTAYRSERVATTDANLGG